MNSVTCVKQGGKINVASGAIDGQAGLAVVMTDAEPADRRLAGYVGRRQCPRGHQHHGRRRVGSADVKVDGSTYTITGEATGADIKNPMAGMITKPFTVKVTCS